MCVTQGVSRELRELRVLDVVIYPATRVEPKPSLERGHPVRADLEVDRDCVDRAGSQPALAS